MAKYSAGESFSYYIIDDSFNKNCSGTIKLDFISCEVDFDSNKPWAVRHKIHGFVRLGIAKEKGEKASIRARTDNAPKLFCREHAAHITAGLISDANFPAAAFSGEDFIQIDDIRTVIPDAASRTPHTFVKCNRFGIWKAGGSAWWEILGGVKSVTIKGQGSTVYPSIPLLIPKVVGGNRNNWRGSASRNTSYAYRNVRFTASYSGFTKGNADHTIELWVGGKCVATQSNQSSGSFSATVYVPSPQYKRVIVKCDGKELFNENWWFQEPPPAPPTMGSVNNTTGNQINTTQRKNISANWYRGDTGWKPNGTITYNWECYYGNTCINSGTTTSTSVSFPYNISPQHTGADLHFRVRARTSTNNLGYCGWMNSGYCTLFWAYTEPAKVSGVSISPTRFQLFYGNKTSITTNAVMRVNGWGDRPGNKNTEFRIHNGTRNSHVAWFGRHNLGASDTGNVSQKLTVTVPDANVNDVYQVWAHKRLGDTEYTTSSDPRYPTIGDNRVHIGNISFYEVIGKIKGSFSIDPNIIISGLPSTVNYTWEYDRQSSNKVSVYLEVYDLANRKLTKTFNFESNINESKTVRNSRSNLVLIDAQKAGSYELRLKATITELLGNTHTYTLATMEPENYNPPVPRISINHVSKPLPTTNASSLLAKQDTDITWNYNYSFAGVNIVNAVVEVNSKPFGRQEIQVPFSSAASPYFGTCLRKSTGEFTLDSSVTARLRIYYSIHGDTRVWVADSNILTVKITHTRYMFYYTTTKLGERQMIQMRALVSNGDKVLRKIHIEDPK